MAAATLARSGPSRKRITAVFVKAIAYIILGAMALTMLFPFYWMVISSLKTEVEIFEVPPKLLPIPPRWENYHYVFTTINFGLYTLNSLKVAFLWMVGVVLSSAWAAYGFARVRFWGRDVLFIVTLAALMIPGQVTMIPMFILMNKLGWVNTHLPLWLPAFFGSAFGIFLLRQYFLTIPEELLDAARIDGCAHFGIFWRVIMPLAKPALASLALLSFMGSWNNLLGPVIYLYDESLFTLPLGLTRFRGNYVTYWSYMMVGGTLTVLPILVLFFFTQQYFVRGVVLTGLKG
jgi:multiple sugar transport system permease protein